MVIAVIGILPLGAIFVCKGDEIVLLIIFIDTGIAIFIRYGGYVVPVVICIARCGLVPVLDARWLILLVIAHLFCRLIGIGDAVHASAAVIGHPRDIAKYICLFCDSAIAVKFITDSGLVVADFCDIAVCVVGVFGKIFVSCMEISLPVYFIIDHTVFNSASHNLFDDTLFLIICVRQIPCAIEVRDRQQIAVCVVGEADAVLLRISNGCKALVLVQQADLVSCLVRHFGEISILIRKFQFLAMPAGNFQYFTILICLDTVLCETILYNRSKMTAVVIMVLCTIKVCHIIIKILIAFQPVCRMNTFCQIVLFFSCSVKRNDAAVGCLEVYICIVCIKHIVQRMCPLISHFSVMAASL